MVAKKKKVAKRKTVKKKAPVKKKSAARKNPVKRRARKKVTLKRRPKKAILVLVPTAGGIAKGLADKRGYWTGSGWDSSKTKAARYPSVRDATSVGHSLPVKERPNRYYYLAVEKV